MKSEVFFHFDSIDECINKLNKLIKYYHYDNYKNNENKTIDIESANRITQYSVELKQALEKYTDGKITEYEFVLVLTGCHSTIPIELLWVQKIEGIDVPLAFRLAS